MKKRTITKSELQRLRPPMPAAFEQRALQTLHDLPPMEEEPIMKKKISLSLVLAIILIVVLAAVAVAVMYWRDTAQKIAPIAAEKGYFEDWPAEERVELLRILNEAGALQEDVRTREVLDGKYPAEEAGAIATDIIITWAGKDEELLTFMTISAELNGKPFSQWSVEDKAWFSEVLREHEMPGNDDNVVPGTEDFDEETALALAKKTLAEEYGLPDGALDSFIRIISFLIPSWEMEGLTPGEPMWSFSFSRDIEVDGLEGSEYYQVALDRQGNVLDSYWSNPQNLESYYSRLRRQYGGGFRTWSHAERAAFSEELPALIAQARASGDRLSREMRTVEELKFGIPTADAIPEESAIEISKAHVMETYGATEGENGLPRLECYIFFDITDPNRPVWRVQYMGRESEGEDKYESNGYVVFVDATNGEVIDSVKWDADVEFMFPDAFI